jgi:hypothetical protein
MKRYYFNKLRSTLQLHFQWKNSFISLLSSFIPALIVAATVNLSRLSSLMQLDIKRESRYRRLQNFFKNFKMNIDEYALFIVSQLPKKERFYLVIDRTNWKFGKKPINILMLGIIYKKMCFPLYWMSLEKGGSSNTSERIELLEKAIKLLGKQRIIALLGDREFIGLHWFKYLIDLDLEFHIRLPKQIKIGSILKKNRKTVTEIFSHWKENICIDHPKEIVIQGFQLFISGMRSKKDYCVVVSNKNNINSLKKYQFRWRIEDMFFAFKSRGFNFEDTHMTEAQKIEKLLVLVSIAYSWCVLVGLWLSSEIRITIKIHGRKAKSIFRSGFDYLTNIFVKLLDGSIHNKFQYKEVTNFLSCT